MNYFGSYYPVQSFWHELDPRSVIFVVIALMIAILGSQGPGVLIALGILLLLYWTAGSPLSFVIQLLCKFKWFLLITLGINWLWAMPVQEREVLEAHQFMRAIMVCLRLIGTLLIANWFSRVVRPLRLIEAVTWFLRPLAKLKPPMLDLALILMLVVRFIPELLAESDNIIIAQRLRGIEPAFKWERSGLWVRSTLIPIFKRSVRKATLMAIAMEARGYLPGVARSSMEELKFNPRDYLVTGWAGLVIILVLASR